MLPLYDVPAISNDTLVTVALVLLIICAAIYIFTWLLGRPWHRP